jgi:thymidylate kinase
MLGSGLAALDAAGVPYRLRREEQDGEPEASPEIDICLAPSDRAASDAALGGAGFHRVEAPGHASHRFYVAFADGQWAKIDAKLSGAPHRASARLRTVLARRRPAGVRRKGPVIAVLGPDGAGKGTVISTLRHRIPLGVTVVYLGRPRRAGGHSSGTRADARVGGDVRDLAFVVWRFARMWRLLLGGYTAAWRGHIVLCDRHPIEILAVRPRRTRLAGAVERRLVARLLPRPDRLVVLDAPGDVLHARSGEHSSDLLERHRRAYVDTFGSAGAVVISTLDEAELVADRVSAVVWAALSERCGWPA